MAHLSEELIHTTVRIETFDASGVSYSGTGFFFNFVVGGAEVLIIVTNRHVLSGMAKVALHLTRADSDGNPIFGLHERIELTGLDQRTEYHGDADVDLAFLYAGDILNLFQSSGKPLYVKASSAGQLPSQEIIESLTMFEEVLMIGYPNGIWDSSNNLPIVRRGFTATPYVRDYQGRKEFVIDAACFPGSSGSPIYLYNQGSYSTKNGGLAIGNRFALLGILFAGPQHTAQGEIVIASIPTSVRPVPISRIPNHLGICIKSARILDFASVVQARSIKASATVGP